jgi:cell division protein FtsB
LLLIGLLVAMATKPLMQLTAQKERLKQMSGDLSQVEGDNADLGARIERFKDPDYIEQKAREQAGLVRPGEIPYVVMPPSKEARAAKSKPAKEAAVPVPEDKNIVQRFLEFAGFM